jgi:hypothetical protein
MNGPVAVERSHSAQITAPWPSVGRLRTPKPRLIVALERLPSPHQDADLARELRCFDPRARIVPLVASPPSTQAEVRLGGHVTEVHGLPARFDIGEVLPAAQWSDREKARLASHEAYVMCAPKTSTGNAYEQYLSLYRIASAYGAVGGLCGVVNPLALSFTPPVAVQNLLAEEMIAQCRHHLPPQLFTSFAQYFGTGGVWCASKGQEVFGVPNFAYFATPEQAETIFTRLWRLFLYGYEEGVIYSPGDEIELSADLPPLRLHRVSDVAPGWEPYLETVGGTMVLTSP